MKNKYRVFSRVVKIRSSLCEGAGSNLAPDLFFKTFFCKKKYFHALKRKNFIKFQLRQCSLVVWASIFALSRSWVRFLLFFGFFKKSFFDF